VNVMPVNEMFVDKMKWCLNFCHFSSNTDETFWLAFSLKMLRQILSFLGFLLRFFLSYSLFDELKIDLITHIILVTLIENNRHLGQSFPTAVNTQVVYTKSKWAPKAERGRQTKGIRCQIHNTTFFVIYEWAQ